MLYNAVDCVISTAVGEGWGLSWIEAMATKTPVIMPGNTALIENITEERGFLAKSGVDPNLYTVLPHDNEVVRPLVDVNDMVEKMLFVYNNYDEALRRAENAFKWVTTDLNWQGAIAKRWLEVFDNAYKELVTEPDLPKISQEKPQIQAEQF
jgi:glycosyltransferase involved in cell wall biosynthesis